MTTNTKYIETVGRRKTAIARVRLTPGKESFTVNDRDFKKYFPTKELQKKAVEDISNIKDELMSDAKFSQKLEMIAQGGEGGGGGMEAMLGGGGPEGGGGGGAPPPPDGGEQEGPFETESGRRRKDDKGDPDPIFPDEPYDPEGKTPYKLKKRYTHIEEEGTLQDTLIDAIDAELEDMDDRDVLTESVSGTDIFKRSLAQVQVLEAKKNKLFEGLESKRKKRYSPQYGLDTK